MTQSKSLDEAYKARVGLVIALNETKSLVADLEQTIGTVLIDGLHRMQKTLWMPNDKLIAQLGGPDTMKEMGVMGHALKENEVACQRALMSAEAAYQRLLEARAHIAITSNRLKLPTEIAKQFQS